MKIFIVIPVLVAVALGSFMLGARYGTEAYLYKNAKYSASMATYRLRYLDAGKVESLRSSLNTDLDEYLLMHIQGQNNSLSPLWAGLNEGAAEALRHASTYRKKYPTKKPSKEFLDALGKDSEVYVSDLARLEEFVAKYGE